ncbi:XRE family transcriptional regulator [Corynebacterium guangdongense]|uniref:Zn-dependent peptidase ImmA (M78 family)/DNA-binding XRE family transcriptional regulator n=1 Tax=Corynebacterium guangdongense TaxID=1783348 RepID=A0ABU1ZTU5_9CORY|nr:XRE family transcriptional regulator [Corynebacterium guangdongense]MDR7328341.1 Zn-dependent peptidase ImmA (M78 family)/DNA-binding XRE family transcriptional regulator [Corynebacterium guangdongense]WJZ16918.1 Helix-turn-helix protein [Corynebacterium guangdongense]
MSTSDCRRGNPGFLFPERLTIARQRRGLTKTALAAEVGVTPRTITRYETDGAPLDMGASLSTALGFPARYFERPLPEVLSADTVAFRAGQRVSARARHAAVATGTHGVELAWWVRERFTVPAPNVPRLDYDSPEEAALTLRTLWGLGTKPLPNLVQLAESHGIAVLGLPPIAGEVDAFSTWVGQQPFIFLARRRTPEGVRFDVAHEIGHLVMHSSRQSGAPQDEGEANRFASEFLMPTETVRRYLPSNPAVPDLLRVKKYFGASAQAMARKAKTIGLQTEWTARMNQVELDKLGYRKAEPGGMAAYERSRVFDFIFSSERSTRYTPAGMAQELALPDEEVHALTLNSVMVGAPSAGGAFLAGSVPGTEPAAAPRLRVVK